ncbi:hypothetical protein BJX63DRAFT_420967 [Aspergillus granulosus]|uniref:Uncharacterized protein n=1 Tax=Aspergillus granulosus TaxID=176169 RepID=A0ABR4HFM8_9EURO
MDVLNNTSYHNLEEPHDRRQTGTVNKSQAKVKTPSPHPLVAKCGAFTRWVLTPLGFLITIYGLNIIAWGGMLFLLLCNAAPQMCQPDCDSPNSARRIWIEIDSQILNALFCVTGFGLAPWRVRDLYLWGCWRCNWCLARGKGVGGRGLNRLAKIHANWLHTDPETELGCAKPTCTPLWKLDVVVWGNMLNTVFQTCLAVCMWAMNRFNRPAWATGLFVGLACVAAAFPGIIMWSEKQRIRKASEHPGALLLIPHSANGGSLGGTGRGREYIPASQES